MKDFWKIIAKYASPYKKYWFWGVVTNVLSAIFNIFSFTILIPILRILFKMTESNYEYIPFDTIHGFKHFGDVLLNNAYWWITFKINTVGASVTLLMLCIFFVILTFIKTGCYFASSAVMIPIRTGVLRDMRMEIYRKITELPLAFFSGEKKGDILARITGDVGEVENSIMSLLDMIIKNPILIIFYFSTLMFVSWKLTIFTIIVVPGLGWFMGIVGKQLRKSSLQVQELWSDTISQVEETLGGLRVIKAFTAEKDMNDRFGNVTNLLKNKSSKVAMRQSLAHPMSEFLGTILMMIVLWFGGNLILSHNSAIEAPAFIFYLVILYSIIGPLKELARAGYNIPKGLASMDRINKILDAENEIKDAESPVRIKTFDKTIEFKNVNFFYDPLKPVLKNINICIEKGKTVAIVGESGSGKSTLIDLIPRFYDVTDGSVSIDGINIKNIKMKDLRKLMGYVNQEPILFNDSIFNNIAFGVENATMEDVIEAAKIANAHDFIMEKPEGYGTNIGDRGAKLSGGQRQRISIARAILKNPPILILDEATASLDTESERLVQEALFRLMESRTTIAIAHRLSTIKNSDEIFVMSGGKIVERGKHENLIASGGYYKKLYEMQSL